MFRLASLSLGRTAVMSLAGRADAGRVAVGMVRPWSVRYLAVSSSSDSELAVNDGGGGCGGGMKDAEKAIAELQGEIRYHHSGAQYDKALEASVTLKDKCLDHFGKMHPATASAFNNIGLMHKMLGSFDEARQTYQQSIEIYGNIVGNDHASYAAALNNLANLDRSQATYDDALSPQQRQQLIQSAIDNFREALTIREAELGQQHPHTIITRTHLGSALSARIFSTALSSDQLPKPQLDVDQSTWEQAETHLRSALTTAINHPTNQLNRKQSEQSEQSPIQTPTAATAAQNLAVFLKTTADMLSSNTIRFQHDTQPDKDELYAEAKHLYQQALQLRSQQFGDGHPDTVATKYSLAELVSAMGDEQTANRLKEQIMEVYDIQETDQPPDN